MQRNTGDGALCNCSNNNICKRRRCAAIAQRRANCRWPTQAVTGSGGFLWAVMGKDTFVYAGLAFSRVGWLVLQLAGDYFVTHTIHLLTMTDNTRRLRLARHLRTPSHSSACLSLPNASRTCGHADRLRSDWLVGKVMRATFKMTWTSFASAWVLKYNR